MGKKLVVDRNGEDILIDWKDVKQEICFCDYCNCCETEKNPVNEVTIEFRNLSFWAKNSASKSGIDSHLLEVGKLVCKKCANRKRREMQELL